MNDTLLANVNERRKIVVTSTQRSIGHTDQRVGDAVHIKHHPQVKQGKGSTPLRPSEVQALSKGETARNRVP